MHPTQQILQVLTKDLLSSVKLPRDIITALKDADVALLDKYAHEIRLGHIELEGGVRNMRAVLIALSVLKKVPGAMRETEVLEKFHNRMMNPSSVHIPLRYFDALRRYIACICASATQASFRHGPGATAEKAYADDKWFAMRTVPARLAPVIQAFDPLGRMPYKMVPDVPSRVLVVEKDYRGGRIIAAEPAVSQFFQQGAGTALSDSLVRHGYHLRDSSQHAAYMTKFGFGATATIDLKEASDSIQWKLVEELFPCEWVEFLGRIRGEQYCLPDGRTGVLNAAATMGNGFCFPLLTLICGSACAVVTGDWSGKTWSVFGDDIIIPEGSVDRVVHLLTCLGLTINHEKTFRGCQKFRESCGVDLFEGKDVRPIFLRTSCGGSLHDAVKGLRFAHRCVEIGCHETADFVSGFFRSSTVGQGLPLNGWAPARQVRGPVRWNKRLHRMEARAISFTDPERVRNLDTASRWYHAFFKRELSERSIGNAWDVEVMTRTGIPSLRWQTFGSV